MSKFVVFEKTGDFDCDLCGEKLIETTEDLFNIKKRYYIWFPISHTFFSFKNDGSGLLIASEYCKNVP